MAYKSTTYKVTQTMIFLAHIFLLLWILYTLYEGGRLGTVKVLLNFLGVAVYGGLLIRISALVAKRNYQKTINE